MIFPANEYSSIQSIQGINNVVRRVSLILYFLHQAIAYCPGGIETSS